VAEFKVEFQHLSQTRTAVSKPEWLFDEK
jgi:hypothetical protein